MTSSDQPTMTSPSMHIDFDRKATIEKPQTHFVVIWCSRHWKALVSEFLCTALLVLFGCMSCIPMPGTTYQSYTLFYSLGFGLTVLFNERIFGHVSGAHMNPAVSLAGVIIGDFSLALGLAYTIAQLLGSTVGYGILVGLAPADARVIEDGICVSMPGHEGLTTLQTLGVEIMLTAALSFLCCSFWDPVNKDKQDSAPVIYGLAVAGLLLVGGPLSGAGINPAVSFAPSLYTGMWDIHWVYWVGPLTGSGLAAIVYKIIFLTKEVVK